MLQNCTENRKSISKEKKEQKNLMLKANGNSGLNIVIGTPNAHIAIFV